MSLRRGGRRPRPSTARRVRPELPGPVSGHRDQGLARLGRDRGPGLQPRGRRRPGLLPRGRRVCSRGSPAAWSASAPCRGADAGLGPTGGIRGHGGRLSEAFAVFCGQLGSAGTSASWPRGRRRFGYEDGAALGGGRRHAGSFRATGAGHPEACPRAAGRAPCAPRRGTSGGGPGCAESGSPSGARRAGSPWRTGARSSSSRR
jgi:hypothetical protein